MNNKKLIGLLPLSLLAFALGGVLRRMGGSASAIGTTIETVVAASSLLLLAYLYLRERYAVGQSSATTDSNEDDSDRKAVKTVGDKSGGNVSPIFAATAFGIIAIVVIRAFVKGI